MILYITAKKVVQELVDRGFVSYFAGGFVRDFVMKHPSDDIDIVTNASVEEIQKIFPKTIPVGINFGIVIVVYEGHQFEVATFRKESDYIDGRRPTQIVEATPEEDAKRRDFTINGMFYNPITQEIFDYVGGKQDIEKKVISAIGIAEERFKEDRLRMIRAIRYAARFHFTIEEKTAKAIKKMAPLLFPSVAIERIVQEFKKMIAFGNFAHSLLLLYDFNLLQVIFPTLKNLSRDDLIYHTRYIPHFPPKAPLIAYLYELFPQATLFERLTLSDYLKLSNKDKEFTEEMELWRQKTPLDDYSWVQIYAKPNATICLEIMTLHKDDPNYKYLHLQRMEKHFEAILRAQKGKTLIMASDLIALGIETGPTLGQLIKKAEEISVNYHLSDREVVLRKLLGDHK